MSSYTASGLPFESRSRRCHRHPLYEEPDRCSRCDYVRTARRLDRERGDYSRRIIEIANGDTSPRGSFSGRNSDRVRELYNERETRTDRANEDLYSRDFSRSGRELRDILLGDSERSSWYGGSGYSSAYGPFYSLGYDSGGGSGYSSRDRERERERDRYDSSWYSSSQDNNGSSRYSSSRYDYESSRYSNSREDPVSRGYSSSSGRLGQSSGNSSRRDSSRHYSSLPGDEGYSRGGRRGAYSAQATVNLDSDSDDDY